MRREERVSGRSTIASKGLSIKGLVSHTCSAIERVSVAAAYRVTVNIFLNGKL